MRYFLFIPVIAEETEIIQPFLLGCDTKSLRVVQISLTALQRLITNEALSEVCDCCFLTDIMQRGRIVLSHPTGDRDIKMWILLKWLSIKTKG